MFTGYVSGAAGGPVLALLLAAEGLAHVHVALEGVLPALAKGNALGVAVLTSEKYNKYKDTSPF